MSDFLKVPSVKKRPRLIIGVIIVGIILLIGLIPVIGNIWEVFSWSVQKQGEVTNEAVTHNDISICNALPLNMYGDDETHPRQECVGKVNFARYVNEGPTGCLNLSGRNRFDCLVQTAINKNDISICERIPSDTQYLDQFCGINRLFCTGDSLKGECIQRFNAKP